MQSQWQLQYSRQTILPEIGTNGQEKLFKARVGIFGVGGLGTWSALLCAQTGIGYLRLVDRDVVELSNLPRTPLFTEQSIDLPKVEEGAKFLQKQYPNIKIDTYATNIDEESIEELIKDLDLIIDGLDSFNTRYVLNDACKRNKIPFIFAGGLGMQANLSSFTYEKESPCLACFFNKINDKNLPTCETAGVHTSLLAITASLQVSEAIKILTGNKARLEGKLAYFDLNAFSLDLLTIKKSSNCSICGPNRNKTKLNKKHKIIELCGNKSFMIIPKPRKTLDIETIIQEIADKHPILKQGKLGITFKFNDDITISLFKGGNILIRGTNKNDEATSIFDSILNYLV